jgi:hypothetical protein
MANVIQLKRKTTSGAPTLGSLAVGEACFVIPDETLYIKKDAGTLVSWTSGASGFSETDIDTLAKLNAIVTDATLIDTTDSRLSNARTPTAHAHTVSDITDYTSDVNAKISAAIDALVGGAPGALDTLNELAAAMADDAAFSATMTAALATKLDANSTIDGGTI